MIREAARVQTMTPTQARRPSPDPPPLVGGDHLSRDEFERRYEAMPGLKKAELIEGIVYLPSPARIEHHGSPHAMVATWLGSYAAATPGVQCAVDPTVRLDLDNEPQPDAMLRVLPERGGRTATSADGYVEGAPELVAEVAASSASYDLHAKLHAYRRNGVREYVVWRVIDNALDWFVLEGGRYVPLAPDADGLLRSRAFPGLWLDAEALLARDLKKVLARAAEGVHSDAHAAFMRRLDPGS
jgi:Uma2 family endonuclease